MLKYGDSDENTVSFAPKYIIDLIYSSDPLG
jgi:hypothetical protein